jgi:hypothetical protein
VGEILGHVQLAAASDNTHSDRVVIGIQDVVMMITIIHEPFMSRGHILADGSVLPSLVDSQVLIGEANVDRGFSLELVGDSLMCGQ